MFQVLFDETGRAVTTKDFGKQARRNYGGGCWFVCWLVWFLVFGSSVPVVGMVPMVFLLGYSGGKM